MAASAQGTAEQLRLIPVEFASIAGWSDDDQGAALTVFLRSCSVFATRFADEPARTAVADLCSEAASLTPGELDRARDFFQRQFSAYRIGDEGSAFLTGYFEPQVDGALKASNEFPVPLYRKPDDLVVAADDGRRPDGFSLPAGREGKAGLEPYATRAEIEAGALSGRGLELVFVRDTVTAFFIHIQGSARVRLQDGRIMRVGFAAKNGHPYTSIGKYLSDTLNIPPEEMTADRLRDWLQRHPDEAGAVMAQNKSYVFFRDVGIEDPALGPLGGAGVALTPLRSLAVDRRFHAYGLPVFVDADLPDGMGGTAAFKQLLVAQDTGSAIIGAARGDLFVGTGEAAGHRAGLIRHPATFILLWPKQVALPDWAEPAR